MGFYISGAAATRQPGSISLLDMAQDIMRSNGMIPLESVENDTSKHGIVAVSSINRALSRIWSAAHWDWRIKWIPFIAEDLVFMYELPDDYEWYMSGPTNFENQYGLTYIEYELLTTRYPDLSYSSIEALTTMPYGHVSQYQEQLSDGTHTGVPSYWGIRGSQVFLYPVPDSRQFDDAATWTSWKNMLFGYYTAFKKLTESDDVIPVPANLIDTVFFLANAYFKQAFEYPDFSVDEQRGEGMLRLAVNRNRLLHPENAYSHLRTNMSAWGPNYGP